MPKKTYHIDQLFKTSWDQVSSRKMVEVWTLKFQLADLEARIADAREKQEEVDLKTLTQFGLTSIAILRLLRISPRLVDKINVEQAVDCINDITFFRKPWLSFRDKTLNKTLLLAPDEKMHDRTLDHFIYADNEYSLYLIQKKKERLCRLAASLYSRKDQPFFFPDYIDERADTIEITVKDWQLELIFYTYANIREFIMDRCKNLFPKSKEKGLLKPTGPMWLKLKHRLAETPVFQGFDTAGRAKLYDALDYLEGLAAQKAPQS